MDNIIRDRMASRRFSISFKKRPDTEWTKNDGFRGRNPEDSVSGLIKELHNWTSHGYIYAIIDSTTGFVILEGKSEDFCSGKYDNFSCALPFTPQYQKEGESKMAATTAHECVVILHAKPARDAAGNDVTEDSVIVGTPRIVMAKDQEVAKLIVSRDLKLTDEELGRTVIKVRII